MYTWQQMGSVVAEETNCAGFSYVTVRNQNLKKNKNLGFLIFSISQVQQFGKILAENFWIE